MVRVVIVGAGGYSGAELVSILLQHGDAEIVGLYVSGRREKDEVVNSLTDVFPRFRGRFSGRIDPPVAPTDVGAISAMRPDAVFLATPHEASAELTPALRAAGNVGPVFDLSGAFRLRSAALYPAHYGFEHARPEWLARAVYGLPELFRRELAGADLVAVPGCYATSAIVPLRPLARAGALRAGTRPIVDAISGVSGAGRGLARKSLFCEVSVQAYNVFKHRHTPEIALYAGVEPIFTPHLGPYERGILATIHADLAPGWSEARVREALTGAYAESRFVRVLPPGQWPAVADVRHTNFCDIGLAADGEGGHLVLCSAIDNLVKGAAGQAVQCMNIRLGLDEARGLSGMAR